MPAGDQQRVSAKQRLTRRGFLASIGLGATAWMAHPHGIGSVEFAASVAQRAADRGLAHLASTQLADGSWPDGGQGAGVVAACLLAFLAHGHLPTRSPSGYAQVVDRAREWLLAHAAADGSIIGRGPSPMYQHGLATLALAESLGAAPDHRVRHVVEGAVDVICRCQNPRGGWRHQLSTTDGDESPGSVGQLMALRSASNIGLVVRAAVLHDGEAYVRSCQSRVGAGGDGGFRYTIETAESNWPRTGAGCCALQMAGNYDDAAVLEGLAFIDRFAPIGKLPVVEAAWWSFGAYYVALASWFGRRLPGGRARWDTLYPGLVEHMLIRQRADGGWSGDHEPYETAAHLLVLGIPNDYLPIHQA